MTLKSFYTLCIGLAVTILSFTLANTFFEKISSSIILSLSLSVGAFAIGYIKHHNSWLFALIIPVVLLITLATPILAYLLVIFNKDSELGNPVISQLLLPKQLSLFGLYLITTFLIPGIAGILGERTRMIISKTKRG